MFVLILAGGVGTRLWPHSRTALPKQLLALAGGQTMIQATVNRVLPIVPLERIFVATNQEYSPLVEAQLPGIPRGNIIAEPSGKSTAPCIGLAAMHMQQLEPEAVMASLHADHFIADEAGFRQALLAAAEVAQQGYLVTLGVKPDKPETGYGYVQRGGELGRYNNQPVYQVSRFLEKPDVVTAEKFVASGEYYWNSGIFIWQISTLLAAFNRYMPEFHRQLGQIEQALQATAGEATTAAIEAIWSAIQPESIDVGIMERAEKVAVVPMDIGWNDVGSWLAIHEINQADENNNVVLDAEHISFDTTDTLIQGHGRLIATLGLHDLVIVDSDDAILVCTKDKVQDIKKVVNWLKENNRTDLL